MRPQLVNVTFVFKQFAQKFYLYNLHDIFKKI